MFSDARRFRIAQSPPNQRPLWNTIRINDINRLRSQIDLGVRSFRSCEELEFGRQ